MERDGLRAVPFSHSLSGEVQGCRRPINSREIVEFSPTANDADYQSRYLFSGRPPPYDPKSRPLTCAFDLSIKTA
jgi:hypothetical protein